LTFLKVYTKLELSDRSVNLNKRRFTQTILLSPAIIHRGFNTYRASLSQGTWTELDRTISDIPMTFIQGMGDPIVRSIWTDLMTNWYTNIP